MAVTENQAKTLLRKQKRVDSWFLSAYGMNLYRGCTHNCAYCDGRAERYHVAGEFGRDVEVKVNAREVLWRELDPQRKRKPMKRGYVLIGGGVTDAYQPIDETYALARGALEIIEEFGHPVHVLTKSTLVERDLDVLRRIDAKARAIVSMSFSTVDDELAAIFEPACAPPSERLATLARCREAGLATGAFLMPVIPFVTDTPGRMDASVRRLEEVGVDFVLFGAMTLKDGRQSEHFHQVLAKHSPELKLEYATLYGKDRWGSPRRDYYETVQQLFEAVARHHGVARRVPPRLWLDRLDENDRVMVALDHLDYFTRSEGRDSTYGMAARSIAKLTEPLSSMRGRLRELNGVGRVTERIVRELLDTGRSKYHDSFFP